MACAPSEDSELGVRPVWSESSLSASRKLGSLATQWAHSENSHQTGRMPRLIWLFAGCTVIFISPEPSGSQCELIVYPCSGVRYRRRRRRCRRQQCLNIFSSETALSIKAKFYDEPPWEGGTKVYINGPGHMTTMAAMPIYGKNH